jgi:hypothetical protein
MIIDYGNGGRYPGVEIIEFPQIYGWFGIPAADVFIAKITARVSTPEIDFSLSTCRIDAMERAPEIDFAISIPRIDASIQVIPGNGTMIP